MPEPTDGADKRVISDETEPEGDRLVSCKAALSGPARRALEEAEARRKEYLAEEASRPKEIGGRGGKDPNRYGDWEVKGLASDF